MSKQKQIKQCQHRTLVCCANLFTLLSTGHLKSCVWVVLKSFHLHVKTISLVITAWFISVQFCYLICDSNTMWVLSLQNRNSFCVDYRGHWGLYELCIPKKIFLYEMLQYTFDQCRLAMIWTHPKSFYICFVNYIQLS